MEYCDADAAYQRILKQQLNRPAIIQQHTPEDNLEFRLNESTNQKRFPGNISYVLRELRNSLRMSRNVRFLYGKSQIYEFRIDNFNDSIIAIFIYNLNNENHSIELERIHYRKKEKRVLIILYEPRFRMENEANWRDERKVLGIEEDMNGKYESQLKEVYGYYKKIESIQRDIIQKRLKERRRERRKHYMNTSMLA